MYLSGSEVPYPSPLERVREFFTRPGLLSTEQIDRCVQSAMAEDIRTGDLTTRLLVPRDAPGKARIVAKAPGRVAGVGVARRCFEIYDDQLNVTVVSQEGARVAPGDQVLVVEGALSSIVTAERVALNFLRRMCGIATGTARLVELLVPYRTEVLDTRKTAPGLRVLDKYAVRMGGGLSHRSGLDDLILVKENHIEAAGGLTNALPTLRDLVVAGHLVEVEVTGLDHALAVAETGVSLLLLDNMRPQEMAEVVMALTAQLGPGRPALEASGNVTRDTIAAVGATGVDYVSSGSLTHSTSDLDLSLLV